MENRTRWLWKRIFLIQNLAKKKQKEKYLQYKIKWFSLAPYVFEPKSLPKKKKKNYFHLSYIG